MGQRRTLIGKFLTFYAMVTLLPTLAGFSLYWSGRLISADGMTRFFAPFMIELLGLVMMNKLLPRTNVDWSAAAAGALATAWLLEATKYLFVHFAERIMLKSYNSVYGPLGLVPLVLVWIYARLGADPAGRGDHARPAEPETAGGGGPAGSATTSRSNGLVAAAAPGGRGSDARGRRRRAPQGAAGDPSSAHAAQPIERIVDRLKARGLIAEVRGDLNGYVPGRAASAIRLDEVLATFRSTDVEIADGATSPALRELVVELDEERKRRIGGLTIADLMPAPVPIAASGPTPGEPREHATPAPRWRSSKTVPASSRAEAHRGRGMRAVDGSRSRSRRGSAASSGTSSG